MSQNSEESVSNDSGGKKISRKITAFRAIRRRIDVVSSEM